MTEFMIAVFMLLFGLNQEDATLKFNNDGCSECYDQAKMEYYESLLDKEADGGGLDTMGAG